MGRITVPFYSEVAVLGKIDPVSSAVAVNSGYQDASRYEEIIAIIQVGLITATGTLDAKLQQATDSGGTGVKDITGKAITQLADSADNKVLIIRARAAEFDVAGGFDFVRLLVTPAVAASLVSAVLLGCNPRYEPVPTTNVHQIVD